MACYIISGNNIPFCKNILLISILPFLILIRCEEAFAASRCISLEECIGIAFENSKELKASLHSHKSSQLNLVAKQKGLGYRSELILSYTRNDQDIFKEDQGQSVAVTDYQHRETLSIRQIFPWGGSFDISGNIFQSDTDNQYFEGKYDNIITFGATLQQELFIPIEQRLDIEEASYQLEESLESVELTKRKILFETEQAFYELVRAQKTLEIRRKSYEISEALSNLSTKQFESGISVDVGLLEARISLELSAANLQYALLNVENAKNNLLRTLGGKVENINVCASFDKTPVSIPREKVLKLLISDNPTLKILDKQLKQKEVDKKREIRIFHSSLVLEGSFEKKVLGTKFSKIYNDTCDEVWTIGLTLNIPIWDNGLNKNKIDAIEYQAKSLQSTITANRLSLERDAINTVESVNKLEKTLASLEAASKYAEKNMELMNEKFARGLNEVYDVIRAEQNLTNAQLNLINGITNYHLAVSRLCFLTGSK